MAFTNEEAQLVLRLLKRAAFNRMEITDAMQLKEAGERLRAASLEPETPEQDHLREKQARQLRGLDRVADARPFGIDKLHVTLRADVQWAKGLLEKANTYPSRHTGIFATYQAAVNAIKHETTRCEWLQNQNRLREAKADVAENALAKLTNGACGHGAPNWKDVDRFYYVSLGEPFAGVERHTARTDSAMPQYSVALERFRDERRLQREYADSCLG